MKRFHFQLFGIFLLLSVIVGHVYLQLEFPYTHDAENHLARMANYKLAVRQGQFPPRWAPNLMHHFGYPVFLYNYPLANILSLPLSFIKVPYEYIFKFEILVAIFILFTGSWLFLSLWEKSHEAKLFALVSLAASPVLISTLVFRGSIGEVLAMALMPWIIYLSVMSLSSHSRKGWARFDWILAVIAWTAFFLSHNISVLYGTPLIFISIFLVMRLKQIQWSKLAKILSLAAGLSFWFWLPALAEKSLVVLDGAALSQQVTKHLLTFSQLWISPLTFGFSWEGQIDSASVGFGLLQLSCILIATLWLIVEFFIRKQEKEMRIRLTIMVLVTILLLFLQTTGSALFWNTLPLVKFIQFPWRLSVLTTIFALPLLAKIWHPSPKGLKVVMVLMLLVQLLAVAKLQPVDRFHKPNASYEEFSQSTSTGNENLAKTFTFSDLASWQPAPTFLTASGSAEVEQWTGTYHKYVLQVSMPGQIAEPTMVFPGWQTFVQKDGKTSIPAYIDSDQIGGRIAYQLDESGSYKIVTSFTKQTWPRFIGNVISILSAIMLALFFIVEWRKKKQ